MVILYSFAALMVYILILKLGKFVFLMSIREVHASGNILVLGFSSEILESNELAFPVNLQHQNNDCTTTLKN